MLVTAGAVGGGDGDDDDDGDGDGMLLEVVMWRRWPRRHDFLCRQSVTNQLRKFWHEGTNPGLDLTPESTQTRNRQTNPEPTCCLQGCELSASTTCDP